MAFSGLEQVKYSMILLLLGKPPLPLPLTGVYFLLELCPTSAFSMNLAGILPAFLLAGLAVGAASGGADDVGAAAGGGADDASAFEEGLGGLNLLAGLAAGAAPGGIEAAAAPGGIEAAGVEAGAVAALLAAILGEVLVAGAAAVVGAVPLDAGTSAGEVLVV